MGESQGYTPEHRTEPLTAIAAAHDEDIVPPGFCRSKGSGAVQGGKSAPVLGERSVTCHIF